jgi:hypothetical protein
MLYQIRLMRLLHSIKPKYHILGLFSQCCFIFPTLRSFTYGYVSTKRNIDAWRHLTPKYGFAHYSLVTHYKPPQENEIIAIQFPFTIDKT